MSGNTQKLSIRLLKDDLAPEDGLREGVTLEGWSKIDGAQIALGTMGGQPPKWSRFLELSGSEKAKVFNHTAYGLVFIEAEKRWFAVSFGMGHVKLDPARFEQDFGLRVVLNAVDPKQLKSADVRTPDENTLSRRSQTSRGSDQTAFAIDVERDIVRGLAGKPKDQTFASRVAGTDSLSMDRKLTVTSLPKACAEAYAMYQKDDYKKDFAWIDQIKHVREAELIEKLNFKAVEALNAAVKGAEPGSLHLAFPVIYDPEKSSELRYKGFRSKMIFPDLELAGYLDALRERGTSEIAAEDFAKHAVHEVDDQGRDCGGKWSVADCLGYETELDGLTYVLSGGRWYQVDADLAKEVQDFFDQMPRVRMPEAQSDENEEAYNERLKAEYNEYLCLDRRLVTPSGASSTIEICDFLTQSHQLIHVKNETSASRLSHLFNQGTVSARVLILDGPLRDEVRERVGEVQGETDQSGFEEVICGLNDEFRPGDFTVVYAVIGTGDERRLSFFSLVTLRQAARELRALGYKQAFSWIRKPPAVGKKPSKPDSDDGTAREDREAA